MQRGSRALLRDINVSLLIELVRRVRPDLCEQSSLARAASALRRFPRSWVNCLSVESSSRLRRHPQSVVALRCS